MKQSGGSASQKRRKNQEMAAMLKAAGDERLTGRCCICYRIIPVGHPAKEVNHEVFDHISMHARGGY